MSELHSKMTALADAVRNKAELTEKLTIDDMTAAVRNLNVGGGITPDVRTLSVTPTKEQQTFSSSDLGVNTYYSTVTVTAIPPDYIDTTDATAGASDILSGKIAYTAGVKLTGRMTDHGKVVAKVSNVHNKWWNHISGYYESIEVGVTTKSLEITPSKSTQKFNNVIDEGDDVFYDRVTVAPIPAEYITTADATATEGTVLEGETAYVNGAKITGKYKAPSAEDVRAGALFGYEDIFPGYNGGEWPQVGTFTSDADAAAGDIYPGKTAYVNGVKVTGTMPLSGDPIIVGPSVFLQEGYFAGGDIKVQEKEEIVVAENKVIIPGGYSEEEEIIVGTAKDHEVFTPGTSSIVIPRDTYISGDQVIRGDQALTPENIRAHVSIFDVEGTFTRDATARASDLALGKTAYVDGEKITGTAVSAVDFYKCTAVFGPKETHTLTVTGAGSDCNGMYTDTFEKKNGLPIYQNYNNSSGKWYIYFFSDEWEGSYWVLSKNLDVTWPYEAHYYASNLTSNWYCGESGEEPTPAVTIGKQINNSSEPKTWDGKKFIKNDDGSFTVSDDVTPGLPYGDTSITPVVGGIYNSTCTIAVERLWNGLAIPEEGLVFYASLKEASPVSETGHSLSPSGSFTYTTNSTVPCAYFSGGSIEVSPYFSTLENNSDFCASFWIKAAGSDSGGVMSFAPGTSGNAAAGLLFTINGEKTQITCGSAGVYSFSADADLRNWVHIAAVCSSGVIRLFVNGVSAGSMGMWQLDIDERKPVIGDTNNRTGFYGYISSVRLYSRALTDKEIKILASEFTPV